MKSCCWCQSWNLLCHGLSLVFVLIIEPWETVYTKPWWRDRVAIKYWWLKSHVRWTLLEKWRDYQAVLYLLERPEFFLAQVYFGLTFLLVESLLSCTNSRNYELDILTYWMLNSNPGWEERMCHTTSLCHWAKTKKMLFEGNLMAKPNPLKQDEKKQQRANFYRFCISLLSHFFIFAFLYFRMTRERLQPSE